MVPCDSGSNEEIENIKSELEYSINGTVEDSTLPHSIEYMAYYDSMSEIINNKDKDIKESEHYNNVLDFLVKKICIRGF